MAKRLIIITVVMINALGILAQGSWKEGFVITQKADTLYGLLENNDVRANIQYCNFRETADGSITKYEPKDIRGYRFLEGKFFITKKIDDPEFVEPVFMEYLIQGQANIYRYINERFFIETVDGIEELKNSEELVEYKGDQYVKLKREYILLLNYFMREADMNSQIQTVQYNSKSLINIAKKYHERVCKDEECIIYEKSTSNKAWRYRVAGGPSFSSLNFGLISDTDFGSGFYGGVGVELRGFSMWVEKFSVSLDMVLNRNTQYTIKSVNNDIGVPITYEGEYYILAKDRTATFIGNNDIQASVFDEAQVNINPMTLKFPVLINYYFSKGSLAPYVGLGGLIAFEISQNDDFIYHYYLDNLGKSIPTTSFGFAGRFGLAFRLKDGKELAFETNFDQTRSTNHNRSFRLQRQTFTSGLVFSF